MHFAKDKDEHADFQRRMGQKGKYESKIYQMCVKLSVSQIWLETFFFFKGRDRILCFYFDVCFSGFSPNTESTCLYC